MNSDQTDDQTKLVLKGLTSTYRKTSLHLDPVQQRRALDLYPMLTNSEIARMAIDLVIELKPALKPMGFVITPEQREQFLRSIARGMNIPVSMLRRNICPSEDPSQTPFEIAAEQLNTEPHTYDADHVDQHMDRPQITQIIQTEIIYNLPLTTKLMNAYHATTPIEISDYSTKWQGLALITEIFSRDKMKTGDLYVKSVDGRFINRQHSRTANTTDDYIVCTCPTLGVFSDSCPMHGIHQTIDLEGD